MRIYYCFLHFLIQNWSWKNANIFLHPEIIQFQNNLFFDHKSFTKDAEMYSRDFLWNFCFFRRTAHWALLLSIRIFLCGILYSYELTNKLFCTGSEWNFFLVSLVSKFVAPVSVKCQCRSVVA